MPGQIDVTAKLHYTVLHLGWLVFELLQLVYNCTCDTPKPIQHLPQQLLPLALRHIAAGWQADLHQ